MANKTMTVQEWRETQFLPWKEAAAKYLAEKQRHTEQLHRYVDQLQRIVALLLDGKPQQAMQIWNNLGLQPLLKEIQLSVDGEVITLTEPNGRVQRLAMDDVVRDLEKLLRGGEDTRFAPQQA